MKHRYPIDLAAIAYQAMEKYGFISRFPESVLREVAAMAGDLPDDDRRDATDLRALLWSSIDNPDSRDLDQIEYCEAGEEESIHVSVAIADVDRFVRKDTRTDRHAAHNGTSVYLGIRTFPMLPDQLSAGISSLLPGEDRAAVVITYTVLPDGDTRHGSIFRALITNKAKLVYGEIGDWLEGSGPIPRAVRKIPGLEEQVRLQHEVAQRLRRRRMDKGALDLDTLEAEAVVDHGIVTDLVIERQNPARQLIEEFMVAANETMVHHLARAGIPLIQRIVRVPKHWDGIVETAAGYRATLPKDPDAWALARFLDRQRASDPERFPDLSLTIVKLLGPGEYVPFVPGEVPLGHFALAVMDYTHSTAPNRRYVDIINQRLIKSVIDHERAPYTAEDLAGLAAWLTGREKAAQKAERFMRKAAAALLLRKRIGESFDAIVTGASEKGVYARLITPPAEGRIVQGGGSLKVGEKVRVRLLATDPYNGFIDLSCASRRRR